MQHLNLFKHLRAASYIALLAVPSTGSASVHREYPISSHVYTTAERTVVPDAVPAGSPTIFPYELWNYHHYGYGMWHYGPGLPHEKRYDIMASSYEGPSGTRGAELLNFFALSDVHIRDKESPAQTIYWAYTNTYPMDSMYSGTMLYTTQVLDAAVRTINALHKKTPFDFGISLGDACNATQHNELRWFIDVLDGKVIVPSSGSHRGAHHIDYQKPFKAAGLHKSIPWYEAIGNHDHFWFGFLTPNEYIRHCLTGKKIINLGDVLIDPLGADSRGFYMGAIDGKTPYGTVFGAGPQQNFTHIPKVFASDPKRRSLSKKEWIGEFFATDTHPRGHGYTEANKKAGFACYTFEPKSDLPLKIIVLDDTENENTPTDPQSLGHGHGFLDAKRYHWLLHELRKGQSQGKLMIVAAHAPIGVAASSQLGWLDLAFEAKLIQKLHSYPNLLMWMAGHYHRNDVVAIPSPDPSHPERGFWSVVTASLLAFPQQFRTFRIVRNSDNTISLFVTDVDPAARKNSLAAKSRSYAIGAMEIYDSSIFNPPTGSYNAELFKQLTRKMQKKIQHCSP